MVVVMSLECVIDSSRASCPKAVDECCSLLSLNFAL